MAWKNSSSWAFFVTELILCDIPLKCSIQDNHQGYHKLMKLKWLELPKGMFWRPSSVTKNTQLAEFFQTVYDNHGSEWESCIGADLWINPPPSFVRVVQYTYPNFNTYIYLMINSGWKLKTRWKMFRHGILGWEECRNGAWWFGNESNV